MKHILAIMSTGREQCIAGQTHSHNTESLIETASLAAEQIVLFPTESMALDVDWRV